MNYNPNNIFARILRKEIPCKPVYEDDFALSFHDLYPKAKIHIIAIPKLECIDFWDFHSLASLEQIAGFYACVNKVIEITGIQEEGYKIISNSGKNGGQEIPHYHVHILGGEKL